MIRRAAIAFALGLATLPPALPAAAQEAGDNPVEDEGGDVREGIDLLEEGAQMLLRGLIGEVEPMMKDFADELEPRLRDLARDMGPMLGQLSELVGDLNQYHPPEKLPNGDIILRRKVPTPETDPEVVPDAEGQIDL